MHKFTHILITGASSGIGAALARQYAKPGVTLSLIARNTSRLEAVAAECTTSGATVQHYVQDINAHQALHACITRADAACPLDLVIANAAISAGTAGGTQEPLSQMEALFTTNVYSLLHTIHPAIDCMQTRGRGQIGVVSSLAGYRGLPNAPAYCASKAAVKAYGEGLRPVMAKHGIGVSVICPGFVESGMTAKNRFPMPMIMTAEKAARIIAKGLEHNRARIAFPWPMVLGTTLLSLMPPAWVDSTLARTPEKG